MKTYARIDSGIVAEIIQPMADSDGNEIPIDQRFHPEVVATLVDITNVSPTPAPGYLYSVGQFSLYVPPPITTAELEAKNAITRDALMDSADSATLGMADAFAAGLLGSADAATFKAYAAYKLALAKVDLTQASPVWPQVPSA